MKMIAGLIGLLLSMNVYAGGANYYIPPTYTVTLDWTQPYEGNFTNIFWKVRYGINSWRIRNSIITGGRVRQHPYSFVIEAPEGAKLFVWVRGCSREITDGPKCAKWFKVKGIIPAPNTPDQVPTAEGSSLMIQPTPEPTN